MLVNPRWRSEYALCLRVVTMVQRTCMPAASTRDAPLAGHSSSVERHRIRRRQNLIHLMGRTGEGMPTGVSVCGEGRHAYVLADDVKQI